jgi:uncharacterized protein YjdB
MNKICPRCKAEFECRHDNLMECSCITVTLDAQQLRFIGENYEDCLCLSCLRDVKEGFYKSSGFKNAVLVLCLFMAILTHAQSPYIYQVYDYMPAPGQFVNVLPEYEPGDTQDDMNRKAEEVIAGANHNAGMISLGGYGGYVVFGFDHEVENKSGRYDFRILGNAFYASGNPNGEASREGGSCEPGIVMVARDDNDNGLPDDTWYELAGSEYRSPQTVRHYRITYYRPDENKPRKPHPSNPDLNDIEYIRWTTNGHGDGYLYRNVYNQQPYFPLWTAGETLSFEGTRMAGNAVDESGTGKYFVLYAFHWGYADNHPNADPRSAFNIEWAVNDAGHPVSLPGIHFVKVFTGINQYCGWIGETSTEISGAIDLHLAGGDATVPVFTDGITLDPQEMEMQPGDTRTLTATVTPAGATNRAVTWKSGNTAVATVSTGGAVDAHTAGEAVIQAITNDGYYIATCRVTVRTATPPDPDPPTPPDPDPPVPPDPPTPGAVAVTGVSISHATLEMQSGDVRTLTATVRPTNATNKAVAWESLTPGVATVSAAGAGSSSATVSARTAGTAVIRAVTVDGHYAATCHVTVRTASTPGPDPDPGSGTAAVTGVSLSHNNLTLFPGDMVTLTADVRPANATNKAVRWTSSVMRTAIVTVNGLLIADAPGTTVITATTVDGGYSAHCTVTVNSPTGTDSPPSAATTPKAWYTAGTLYLRNLEGYDCTLISLAGQTQRSFRPSQPYERIPLSLPRGLYLFTAQKEGKRESIFLMVN